MRKVLLYECGDYVRNPKISTNLLSKVNYITTDNMLPNKKGIEEAANLPQNTNVIKFEKHDILISNIRPYFKKIWLAEFSGGCSSDVLVFRTNKNYNPIYIKYCLSQDSFFKYSMLGAKGSKMPRGDQKHILRFNILDYDLELQNKIANFLLLIDRKIKLNEKISKTLELLAKTIYDYWFVQFDFPDEKGRPYKSSGGKMVYNAELNRKIPEGWEVVNIQKCCKIVDCLHSKKPKYHYENDKYYLLQLENLVNLKLIDLSKKYFVSQDDFKKWTSNIKVKTGDLVITNAGRVAGFSRVPYYAEMGIGRNITAIRPEKISQFFICYYFDSIDAIQQIKRNTDQGAFFQSFNVKGIKKLYIPIPPKPIQNSFDNIVGKIRLDIEHRHLENETLLKIRDFLLPMLMNGQISVKD